MCLVCFFVFVFVHMLLRAVGFAAVFVYCVCLLLVVLHLHKQLYTLCDHNQKPVALRTAAAVFAVV